MCHSTVTIRKKVETGKVVSVLN